MSSPGNERPNGGRVRRAGGHVRTRRGWMNVLARLVFRSSHDAVMRDGADGLATLLGVRVER